jgi:hypothetical protein
MPTNKSLSPFDRMLLEQDSEVQWVPENPQELILPYVDQTKLTEEEKTDVEKRREKAKEVYDTYSDVIKECEKLEEKIEQRCSGVVVPIEDPSQYNVVEALQRVFGVGTQAITFEMYKTCIKELDALDNGDIPKPEDV